MLDFLFLLIAASIQAAAPPAQGFDTAAAATAAAAAPITMTAPETPAAPATEPAAAPAPAFLAPPAAAPGASADAAATAPPAFLAPTPAQPTGQAVTGAAAPAFLAPTEPTLQAEPQTPTGRFTTATEVRPILAATRSNWIHVRDFNGQDLLYVTHLWSWRCGLAELRVGINGAPPEPWPLPPCHLDQAAPNAILESDGLPYRTFPPGSVAMIEVALTYDDLGTETVRFGRNGVVLP